MREIKFRAWDMEKSEWIGDNGTTFTSTEATEGPVMLSLNGHLRVLKAHHGPLREDENDSERITGCFGGPGHSEYESVHPCDTKPSYKRQYVLEQFTGLKDKNGTEIYEGDIVGGEGFRNCPVQWNGDAAGFEFWDDYVKSHNYGLQLKKLLRFMEVIGNIHEHGDLLK